MKRFSIELVLILAVSNNISHFQVFKDDRHILVFLASSETFEDKIIYEDDRKDLVDEEDTKGIINLSKNVIPKGMITFEHLFDSNPRVKEILTTNSEARKYETFNIGHDGWKKMVFIGKTCT